MSFDRRLGNAQERCFSSGWGFWEASLCARDSQLRKRGSAVGRRFFTVLVACILTSFCFRGLGRCTDSRRVFGLLAWARRSWQEGMPSGSTGNGACIFAGKETQHTMSRSKTTTKGKVIRLPDGQPFVHPGEILLEDFLKPLGISQSEFARRVGIPVNRVNEIVQGKRGISADTAFILAEALGPDPVWWMDLQRAYDLSVEKQRRKRSKVRPIARFPEMKHVG